MTDVDRIIGAISEFKKNTERRLSCIERKLDDLSGFRMKVVGAAILAGILAGMAVDIIPMLIKMG